MSMALRVRAVVIATLALSFSQLVCSHAVELNKRVACNSDNCLRGLLAHSATASPFCSAYLGPSYTTTTLSFTSVCTENPTAVSTACSCLLSAKATTTTTASTTTTTTSTSTSTTSTAVAGPTQCSAANNYGYLYAENTFSFESVVIFPQVETTVSNRGDCCRLCYTHPDCYGFAEASNSADPSFLYCELEIIQPPSSGVNVSSQCPLGKTALNNGMYAAPYPAGSYSGDGQGPCGIFPADGQL